MPFTFAHPAIVIPISKRRFGLSLTGLVIGSMVPDFEFFLRMKVDENIGHHWLGFFVFDIPMSLLLCFLFHNIIRNAFINNLPEWYRCRFSEYTFFQWNSYAASNKFRLGVSIIIGILSHFLWDAFTHYDGTFVRLFPLLCSNILLFNFSIPVYSVLQVASSVWGLWIIRRYIAAMPVQSYQVNANENEIVYWIGLGILSSAILTVRLIVLPQFLTFWDVFFASIGSFLYAWIITSLTYNKLKISWWQGQ
jgi:hypothetical protein